MKSIKEIFVVGLAKGFYAVYSGFIGCMCQIHIKHIKVVLYGS